MRATADSSVVVAALASWHENHTAAAAALADLTRQRDVVEMDSSAYMDLIAIAEDQGIVGGAIYDALIGTTARRHKAALFPLEKGTVHVRRA